MNKKIIKRMASLYFGTQSQKNQDELDKAGDET